MTFPPWSRLAPLPMMEREGNGQGQGLTGHQMHTKISLPLASVPGTFAGVYVGSGGKKPGNRQGIRKWASCLLRFMWAPGMHSHSEALNLGLQQGRSQAGLEVSGLGAQTAVCDLGQATFISEPVGSQIEWEQ